MTVAVTKIFDPADGFAPFVNAAVVTDSTLAQREGRWWMYLAGRLVDHEGIQIFSASLPEGVPLAARGWTLTADPADASRVAVLAPQARSREWDLRGGRHCPAFVRGWDPARQAWVQRIYYAGGADKVWGPYTIGYLEWDGARWVEQDAPVFTAAEEWEHGSVYEPNLVYADGLWRMWYVAGSNQENYLVQGYAESADGRKRWTRRPFCSPEDKMFDFCAVPAAVGAGYEAVFSRVWLGAPPAPAWAGLWWCRADKASPDRSDWSTPVQILTAADRGWSSGPWRPCLRYAEGNSDRMFVFFDGQYTKPGGGPFPFAFTLGCLEIDRPPSE